MKEESDSTITSVVNNLFIPMTKKRIKDLGMKEDEENRYVSRLSREVDASGKDQSVAIGESIIRLPQRSIR
jgi:chromosome transmission fidelity protein 18